MASKEATVYVVDCGSTMGEISSGRQQTNLDWALEWIWDKITSTVATGRKTALVGIVGLRTSASSNELDGEDDYQHITVLQEPAQILMPQIRKLRNELVVNSNNAGDAISALVIAIQMIVRTCKKLQYARKIVVVTDGRAPMQADELSQITDKMKEDNIELVVLGIDFDDAEYGFKEESKHPIKAKNEAILRLLCEDCNGTFGTLAQAIDELKMPRVKSVKSVHSYKGFLTLGNPQDYETAMSIDVERYPKILPATAPTASRYVVRGDISQATQSSATLTNGQSSGNDGLTAVQNARTYQVEDENAPGGKKDVSFDELSKGYEYGRTAVHISESDRNVTTYETQPGLDIMGFVDKNQYERHFDMSRSNMIIPARTNEKAAMALSSLIHALYELESYAVARFVNKENKEPKILLLAPNIESNFECLYDVELPFAEDVRSYKFPRLDRVVTVSGKELKVHRNLPSDDLQDAVSAYVDSMDLSTFGHDSEGQRVEYAAIDESYSPMLHRLQQVIKHRAVFPDSNPPEPYEILTRYSHPPTELIEKARPILDEAIKAANVKKVPPKARGKGYGRKGRDEPKPLSELDIGALLAKDPKRKAKQIDPRNAVPEFKQIIATADEISDIRSACKQLKKIIFDWVQFSVGDSGYGKTVEAIRVMREEMIEMEEPDQYNEFLKDFKKKLLGGELGGERTEVWWLVRVNKLGLVQQKEVESSEVTAEESKAFMTMK